MYALNEHFFCPCYGGMAKRIKHSLVFFLFELIKNVISMGLRKRLKTSFKRGNFFTQRGEKKEFPVGLSSK